MQWKHWGPVTGILSQGLTKPSLSFFVDKMVLVKRLNLQGVAPGLNEFSSVKVS